MEELYVIGLMQASGFSVENDYVEVSEELYQLDGANELLRYLNDEEDVYKGIEYIIPHMNFESLDADELGKILVHYLRCFSPNGDTGFIKDKLTTLYNICLRS